MKLYYHPNSTFSQRVRIAADEKNIALELAVVDMPAAAHKQPPHLERNPYGRVPVLDDDGFILFESTAILEYLEQLFPKPALLPERAKERALVHMHMKLADVEVGVHTQRFIRPTRFVPREKWRLDEMSASRAAIDAHFRVVDEQVRGKQWLVADTFTLAEVCYAPFVRFIDELGLTVSDDVRAWAGRILSRPSVKRTWLER